MSHERFAVEFRGVTKRFESVTAVDDVSLQVQEGEFFSLLGPSGCGKTTSLRLIAGFESPTAGQVLIDGAPMNDLPPYKRPVNTVFQNYALFPHMNVLQNIAFGLEVEPLTRQQRQQRAMQALELVLLPGLDTRKPGQLSGGQQQRVALARALVKQPRVLLLDEPLGALDLKLRKAMQLELKALQMRLGITFVYVTHDQEEALTLSDRMAVMHAGRVLQVGTPEQIYDAPASRFVADFIGETNFIPGAVAVQNEIPMLRLPDGQTLPAGRLEDGLQAGQPALLSIRPEKVQLSPVGSAIGFALIGQITQVVYLGTDMRYTIGLPGSVSLVARQQNTNGTGNRYHIGETVSLHWDVQHARLLKE